MADPTRRDLTPRAALHLALVSQGARVEWLALTERSDVYALRVSAVINGTAVAGFVTPPNTVNWDAVAANLIAHAAMGAS